MSKIAGLQSWILFQNLIFMTAKTSHLQFSNNCTTEMYYLISRLVAKVLVKVVGVTQVAPLPFLLRTVNDGVQQDWFPVDAAAADVDGDVPQPPHFQLLVRVSNQHLGLHLLAGVEV